MDAPFLRSDRPAAPGGPAGRLAVVSECAVPERPYVDRLGPLVAAFGVVLPLGAFGERAIPVAGDAAVVDEEVLAGFVGRDESKALLVAEPLHGATCHLLPPWEFACCGRRNE